MLGVGLLVAGGVFFVLSLARLFAIPDLLEDRVFKLTGFVASVLLGVGATMMVPPSTLGISGTFAVGGYVLGTMTVVGLSLWGLAFLYDNHVSIERIRSGKPEPSPSVSTDDQGLLDYERDFETDSGGKTVRRRRVRVPTADAQQEQSEASETFLEDSDADDTTVDGRSEGDDVRGAQQTDTDSTEPEASDDDFEGGTFFDE